MKFVAFFDNCVTEDTIFKFIDAESIDAAYNIAWNISCGTGLSEGNFELYISDFDHSQEMNKQLNEVYKKIQSWSEGFINGNG